MNDHDLAGHLGIRDALHSNEIRIKDAEIADLKQQLAAKEGEIAGLNAAAAGTGRGASLADARAASATAHKAYATRLADAWKGASAN
jgi:hypothetical protein